MKSCELLQISYRKNRIENRFTGLLEVVGHVKWFGTPQKF
jgi:hypothetical protein